MPLSPASVSLEGRVAVVTGAARGIGAGAAAALAAFGADVEMCDRLDLTESVAAVTAAGRRGGAATLDVRDSAAVASWIGTLARVDVLVNNAGGGFRAGFADISAKGQQALVDENFTSVTNLIRSCLPLMPDGGSIINVTTVEAFRAAPGFSIYSAMKAGVEQLTRTLALELSDRHIRVNCIAPDAIPTPGDSGLVDEGHVANYGAAVPLGLGHTDDCAGAVIYLASDLSRFVTGSTIHVDGGSNAARGWRRRADGGWTP